MTKIICSLLILFSSQTIFSQYSETITSGRPGQAIGPRTVGQNVIQIQSGFTYNQISFDETQNQSAVMTNVFRWGVLEHLEVSSVLVWQNDKFSDFDTESITRGVSNTQIGLRYNFTTNQGWIPAIGFQGRLLLKLQDRNYRRDKLGTAFVLVTSNNLSDSFTISTNWLLNYLGDGAGPNYGYVLNLAYSISDKWGSFFEIYGSLNDFNTDIDLGFFYLVNNDLQLDVSYGFQNESSISNWFVDAGISWRFDWRK
jgi:hypothetical protein